jgi:hypothetical protein
VAARFRLDHLGAPELQPSFDGTKMDVESFGSVRSGPLIATHSVLRLFGEGLLPAIGGSFGEHDKFLCGAGLDDVTVRRREHQRLALKRIGKVGDATHRAPCARINFVCCLEMMGA